MTLAHEWKEGDECPMCKGTGHMETHRGLIPCANDLGTTNGLICSNGKLVKSEIIKAVRPPLGLRPERIWLQEVKQKRLIEVTEAIERYTQALKEIPIQWIEEYNKLVKSKQ